jgi:membrane protein DedA with SNARE-associated domain/rhodanese-related sulfurtransferase
LIEPSLAEHVVATAFAALLVHQLGVPVPAFPVLIWAGAVASGDTLRLGQVFLVTTLAGTVGNLPWYWAGRRYGHRVLKLVCRITLSPDSCVRQTETVFERRGPVMLVIARFLPGFETVAPPLAGALRVALPAFLLYDLAGSALRAGAGLALGVAFRGEISRLLDWLAALGMHASLLVAALLAGYVGYRFRQRRRFLHSLRAARISAHELHDMMARGDDPVVLDVRTRAHRRLDGRQIPGAHAVDLDALEHTLAEVPRERDVVVYCACPNEATAAKVALQLRARGFRRVRPLSGGIDAWASAGLALERVAEARAPIS